MLSKRGRAGWKPINSLLLGASFAEKNFANELFCFAHRIDPNFVVLRTSIFCKHLFCSCDCFTWMVATKFIDLNQVVAIPFKKIID